VVQKENIKKLTALRTELSGNQLAIDNLMADPGARVFISYDCLGLLLNTLYVDLGPDLLKVAYELYWKLRTTAAVGHEATLLHEALHEIVFLATQLAPILEKLHLGQFKEPRRVSTMIWYPSSEELTRSSGKCIRTASNLAQGSQ